jgi:hypothetical protein
VHKYNNSKQVDKVTTFFDLALESLNKHFNRWLSKELLPAALLSEKPLALIVATAIIQREQQEVFDPPDYYSPVHKKSFNLKKFQEFIFNGITVGETYQVIAMHAAHKLLQGVDLRDMSAIPIDNVYDYRTWMYSTYLPLASHTQFVEAGVKEAKIVSTSDRSEPLRSAYVINRSARVHSISDKPICEMAPNDRVAALFKSAKLHTAVHKEMQQANVATYNNRISTITTAIRGEHFKHERVEKLKQVATNKSNVNKKENDRQKKTGVDRTLGEQGFFAYGALKKAIHHGPIKEELVHRGVCTMEQANLQTKEWNYSELKKMLKAHEIHRLKDTDNKAFAIKGFQPLSGAVFQSV